MGEAILSGWIASTNQPADGISAADITVVEPSAERRAYLAQIHGVNCIEDISQASAADVVVLSVKPQVMMGMLASLAENSAFTGGQGPRPLFITIAAGLTTEKIQAALPEGSVLVRVMPNMALSIGEGASGVCGGQNAASEQVEYVAGLFGCLGRAVVVDEADMDAVCALSGSGPAYVAAMVEAMRDAAAAEGLDPELAETLALQTVLGTAKLMAETDISVAQCREAVCSPGGTTLAALDAMYAAGFNDVFQAGISAAVRRSKELAQC